MAKSNTKIIYDDEEDILFLSKGKKVKASINIGDFVIDISTDGFVSGIEILNASENLKFTEEQLKGLQQASMIVTYKPNYVCIILVMKIKQMEKDVTIPLTIDLGHGAIKKETTNFVMAQAR